MSTEPSDSFTIRPGVGYGPLTLGMSLEQVRSVLGEPDEQDRVVHADGSAEQAWTYEDAEVEVVFCDDVGGLLGAISVAHDHASLAGVQPLGLAEEDFLALCGDHGIGPLERCEEDPGVLGEDQPEFEMRSYVWDEGGIQFWVLDGFLDSLTILPLYDETEEEPGLE